MHPFGRVALGKSEAVSDGALGLMMREAASPLLLIVILLSVYIYILYVYIIRYVIINIVCKYMYIYIRMYKYMSG